MKKIKAQKHHADATFSIIHARAVLAVLKQACYYSETDESQQTYSTLVAIDKFLESAELSIEALSPVVFNNSKEA